MRPLLFIICLPTLLAAQDARAIVVRAVELDRKDAEIARNYTYLERNVESDLDGSGKPKNKVIRTWDVTVQEGSPYRRLVARDDQPLSDSDQKQEEGKLQWSIEQRRKETPAQRDQRIADWHRKQEKQREPLRELPDAFDFHLLREEAINGGEAYVIDATPKPGYKPKSTATSILRKVKLRLWIDKHEYQWVKAEMESLDTIALGGFLLRIAKGSRLMVEQTRINNEVWLPKKVTMDASARLILLKGYHKWLDITYSAYKKFQTDSRIVSADTAAK